MQTQPTPPTTDDSLRLRRLVVVSFPLAFLAHDMEEVWGARRWQRDGGAALRHRFPNAPARLVDFAVGSPRQMSIAVAVVGLGVATASATAMVNLTAARKARVASVGAAVDGAATAGEMRLLQAAVAAFTAHGITHLAASAALRAYVPGVVTSPLVIAPYSVWAWRTLSASGLPTDRRELVRTTVGGAALALPLVIGGQLLGRALSGRR